MFGTFINSVQYTASFLICANRNKNSTTFDIEEIIKTIFYHVYW